MKQKNPEILKIIDSSFLNPLIFSPRAHRARRSRDWYCSSSDLLSSFYPHPTSRGLFCGEVFSFAFDFQFFFRFSLYFDLNRQEKKQEKIKKKPGKNCVVTAKFGQ